MTNNQDTGTELRSGVPATELTTLGVGGSCAWLADLSEPADLDPLLDWARTEGLPVVYLGEGSNVLFPDEGFPGLIIRTKILGRRRNGCEVELGGGENLQAVIDWLNSLGLGGMERMYGIPGTLAGALVGNAGAYGQEIKDVIETTDVWTPDGTRTLSRADLDLGYRRSTLKDHRGWFVLRCRLRLHPTDGDLARISNEVLEKRLLKYPVGLKCPGSFFKNVIAGDLPPGVLARIPREFIQYGKIPAGRLLEAVGANGARRGGAQVAPYHGNLFMNRDAARAEDILALADEFSRRVLERFGIRLEPEVCLLGAAARPPVGWGDQ
ncbi:MAG: UDP-N-acetylmuramate dehydrogenase [Acidobacteriota bacterium]